MEETTTTTLPLAALVSDPNVQAVWKERLLLLSRLDRKLVGQQQNIRRTTTSRHHDDDSPHQSGSLKVANCDNMLYTTNVGLGEGQSFSVIIDTGSSDLWVTGYKPSSSFREVKDLDKVNFEIQYLDGTRVVGRHGDETLLLGDVTVSHQIFAQATSVYNSTHVCDDVGTLGLGFSELSSHGFPALLSNLELILTHPVFSLYLYKHNDYQLERNASTGVFHPIPDQAPPMMHSELTFGGTNASRYSGCLKWHRLGQFRAKGETFKGYWDFGLEKIFVGNQEIPASPLAMIDSGSTIVVGSRESVGHIAKKLGMECYVYTAMGAENVACDHPFGFDIAGTSCQIVLPPVIFQADGTRYILETDDLLHQVVTKSGTICVLDLLGVPGFPGWLMGQNFMRKYYTVFDFGHKALGFALASKHDNTLCGTDAFLNIDKGIYKRFNDSTATSGHHGFDYWNSVQSPQYNQPAQYSYGVDLAYSLLKLGLAALILVVVFVIRKRDSPRRSQYESIQ